MRILFNSIEHPKKAAKRLKKAIDDVIRETNISDYQNIAVTLSEAQKITSIMLGYKNWHELELVTKSNKDVSVLFDEDICQEDECKRLEFQEYRLREYLNNGYARYVLLASRVSSKNPYSKKLFENGLYENSLFFSKKDKEWHVCHSERSQLFNQWIGWFHYESEVAIMTPKQFADFFDQIDSVLVEYPENITAIWLLLCIVLDSKNIKELAEPVISGVELKIMSIITKEFMESNVKEIAWKEQDNRDFLRCSAMIAEIHFRVGNFSKANEWFELTNLMSDQFIEYYGGMMEESAKEVDKLSQ